MSDSKYMTLKELEADKEGTSVWAMNNTNPRGALNLTMPDGLGGTTIMVLPVTWIPVDLTTQATKEMLLKSPVFRRMVTMQVIQLLTEEAAAAIMTDPDAKKEALRVYSVVQQVELEPANANPEVAKLKNEEAGNISGFAMNIVGMDVEEDKVLTMIRGQDGILTGEDYKYIAANSAMGRVKEYCASKAAQ